MTDSAAFDGGSATVALRSAMALAQRGVAVTIFTACGVPSPELVACPNLRIVNTGQGEALGARNKLAGALRGIWNVRAYTAMRKLLATLDRQSTVVHLHGWTKALSSSVVASAVRSGFRIVLTLHEYFAACPAGSLYNHRTRRVCTLQPMSMACVTTNCDSRNYAVKLYRVVRQLVSRSFGRIPGGIRHYITVSRFSRSVIAPMLPANRTIYAVDNPIEAARRPRVRAEGNETFVFVGRLSAEKGVALFAAAAAEAGVRVVFVGDGPERETIERAHSGARITGWMDKAAVTDALQTARAIVVPSLWYETLGLVVLEAAALGIPAIVPEDTAARDLIVAGTSGLAFERGNGAALAQTLRTCADDALIARLSHGAYDAFWRKPPTMRAHVDALLVAYADALGAPARGETAVAS